MQHQSLPHHLHLPLTRLAASFNSVTTSYKFYWLLVLLAHVQSGEGKTVSIHHLLIQMVKLAWYPSRYYKLSFGSQDKLAPLAAMLSRDTVENLESINDSGLHREIEKLGRYVPYRFLRPFFAAQTRGLRDYKVSTKLQSLAAEAFAAGDSYPLYRFIGENGKMIELHPMWYDYFRSHLSIIRAFCFWHLVSYLQKHNPNVPGIPNKLFEPQNRVMTRAVQFWQTALNELPGLRCIYSGDILSKDDFSIDHFIPWSFVTHDLLWNLTPTSKSINSAKGNCLPKFERYFTPFCAHQYQAFQAVAQHNRAKLLDDYVVLFKANSIQEIRSLQESDFEAVLRRELSPQFQIAQNLGFMTDWEYQGWKNKG